MIANMDLAHFDYLRKWSPKIGDFIIYHGWFQHYFGVISHVDATKVEVIRKGIPLLLFNLLPEEYDNNKIVISIGDIKTSSGGKYAAIRAHNNNIIWYV